MLKNPASFVLASKASST